MRSVRRAFLLPILAAALLAPTLAAGGEPTAAERESARRLMDEGKERTKSKDLEGALVAYGKAHAIMHVPTTGMALARTHLALGHLLEARDVALEVARFPKERNEPTVFETARADAREIEASTKDRIPTIRVKVKGPAPSALSIDGAAISATLFDTPLAVNPGHRVVVVANKVGVERKVEVDVAEREKKSVEVELPEEPKGGPSTAASAAPTSTSTSTPASSATADGASKGGGPGRALFIGGTVVAVAGAAAGTVTGLMTLSKADAVKPQCENGKCDPAAKGDLDTGKTLGLVSTISFGVAGAGLVVAIVGLVWPSPKTSSTGIVVRPMVAPGGAGLGGTF